MSATLGGDIGKERLKLLLEDKCQILDAAGMNSDPSDLIELNIMKITETTRTQQLPEHQKVIEELIYK